MNLRRSLAIGVAASLALGASVTSAASAVAGSAGSTTAFDRDAAYQSGWKPRPSIDWESCPEYSDEVLDAIGVPEEAYERFRAEMDRMDCGTLEVPLDYADPRGRRITVGLTRLPATDRRQRLGSLALNPGGPGGSGYLLPVEIIVSGNPLGELNERYDLIGFDPRGVGTSSSLDCPATGPVGPPTMPITEEAARQLYGEQVEANRGCAATDPAFLGSLTTDNIARDMDWIRRGLGERKLNYFGISWGSWLGPVYRSLFPGRSGRMWIESVAPTDPRMDEFVATRSAATARNFSRMAERVAQFEETYGFGATGTEVESAIGELRRDFEANPRHFDDIDFPIDGEFIAIGAEQPAAVWPLAARILADLRDATGPNAPDSLKEVIGPPPDDGDPPEGVPEQFNRTAGQAIFCNGDGGTRDFESWWTAYQGRLETEPVTGVLSSPINPCAGWPLPVERIRLKYSDSSLVLSGHLHETPSPYEWTPRMQQAVGGTVFTVEDDEHASAAFVPDCTEHIVTYFVTGDPGADGCEGVPMPSSPDDRPDVADPDSLATAFSRAMDPTLLISGRGPNLLLPLDPQPVVGEQADELRAWGVDPARGRRIVDGLADLARVVAFDYEGHVLAEPKPDTLTADNVAADLLAVADAAGAETFTYFGYSWTAMVGMQLALRSARVSGLAMGGFPPLDGPYQEILATTIAGYELARGERPVADTESAWSGTSLSADQSRQFVTLYRSLEGFDDAAAQSELAGVVARLCFAGDADEIRYGPDWGDVLAVTMGACGVEPEASEPDSDRSDRRE